MYDLEDLYQEIVMDHNRRPRNFGELKEPTTTADGFNPLCGDQITLQLSLEDGVVVDVAFKGVGCAISKSTESKMTEELKDNEDIEDIMDQPIPELPKQGASAA